MLEERERRWLAEDGIDDDAIRSAPLLPDGPQAVLLVLAVWATLCVALAAAFLALWPQSGTWAYSAAAVAAFLACLHGIRVLRRREEVRRAKARALRRDFSRARHQAFCAEKNYYVLDLLGTKRGPYALEKLVRWYDEGKLGNEPVIYVGSSATPVAFDDVAAQWRSEWGQSDFDPTPLRIARRCIR